MSRQIAAAFALTAFAVSVASGLAVGAPASAIVVRSVVVLLAAGAIGRVLGYMASVALNEHLTAALASDPVPDPIELGAARGAGPGKTPAVGMESP